MSPPHFGTGIDSILEDLQASHFCIMLLRSHGIGPCGKYTASQARRLFVLCLLVCCCSAARPTWLSMTPIKVEDLEFRTHHDSSCDSMLMLGHAA